MQLLLFLFSWHQTCLQRCSVPQQVKWKLYSLTGRILSVFSARPFVQIGLFSIDLFSSGNASRLDYGTGHEATFVMFLTCLNEMFHFSLTDMIAAGIVVFPRFFVFFFIHLLPQSSLILLDTFSSFVTYSARIAWSLQALMACGDWMIIISCHSFGVPLSSLVCFLLIFLSLPSRVLKAVTSSHQQS
jgi:hypothetical protein